MINSTSHFARDLARIEPEDICTYAERHGWLQVSGNRVPHDIYLFNHSTVKLKQLQIPKSTDDAEYKTAVWEVLRRIQEIEKRPFDQIATELIHPESDVLRIHLKAPEPPSIKYLLFVLGRLKTAHLLDGASERRGETYRTRVAVDSESLCVSIFRKPFEISRLCTSTELNQEKNSIVQIRLLLTALKFHSIESVELGLSWALRLPTEGILPHMPSKAETEMADFISESPTGLDYLGLARLFAFSLVSSGSTITDFEVWKEKTGKEIVIETMGSEGKRNYVFTATRCALTRWAGEHEIETIPI